jgi:hypothetical protein
MSDSIKNEADAMRVAAQRPKQDTPKATTNTVPTPKAPTRDSTNYWSGGSSESSAPAGLVDPTGGHWGGH